MVMPSSENRYPTTAPMIPWSIILTEYAGTMISAATATTHTIVMSRAMAVWMGGLVYCSRRRVTYHPTPNPMRNSARLPTVNRVVVLNISELIGVTLGRTSA